MGEKKELVSYDSSVNVSGNYLSVAANQAILNGLLSETDMVNIQNKLWMLLERQTERFTMGDSSSVPVETAEGLLTSINFCIEMYLKKNNNIFESASKLKNENLFDLFALGQVEIAMNIDRGKKLLKEAQESALDVDNISYHDTLKEITAFFKKYDYRFFAHDIPCMIDYQLCHQVPELQGIEYINEYLRRFIIENKFCRYFNCELIISLLQEYCPDYKGQLINIFEPVCTNGIGLALLDKNVFSLNITESDRVELLNLFRLWPEKEAMENLALAADKLYGLLEIEDSDTRKYLKKTAIELYSRIKILKDIDKFDKLFIELYVKKETAPLFQYYDGDLMDDEALRRLIDEIQDCRYLSDKIAIIKEQVHSVRDLIEVLNVCLWGNEYAELFRSFSDLEIAILLHFLHERYEETDDLSPIFPWEVQLVDHIKSLGKTRQKDIERILKRNI
jgi:hypothetical protein